MVSGLACEIKNGRRLLPLRLRGAEPVERVPQKYIHLGMLLQDCNLGVPSQVMVRRRAIENGATFQEVQGIQYSADTWWNCLVAECGDVVLLKDLVVEHHQDSRDTLTGEVGRGDLEAEYPIYLERIRLSIDPALKPPALPVVLQMVLGIRALNYLSRGEAKNALNLALSVRHPRAFWLIARWVLRQRFPSILSVIPRIKSDVPDSLAISQ